MSLPHEPITGDVIMLDVDGVMVHSKTVGRSRGHNGIWAHLAQLDEEAVARVVRIVQATGARLVLSSMWRRHADQRNALGKAFYTAGLRRSLTTFGRMRTPHFGHLPGEIRRDEEIRTWLLANPGVRRAIFIDDEPIKAIPGVWIENGHFTGGIQEYHVAEAIALLPKE